jgi:hypothetical protein
MSATDQRNRTIDACRRAGLPVLDEQQCTCGLRGRLVVLASPDGLRLLWPYDGRCLVHDPPDREAPRPAQRPRSSRSRSRAARLTLVERNAGIR